MITLTPHTHAQTAAPALPSRLRQILLKALIIPVLAAVAMLGAVTLGSESARAFDTSHYTASSVLSQGKWVKVRVPSAGVYFISNQQLKTMGFSDASKVNVYGYGGNVISEILNASLQPDDLPMQPVVRTDKGILFYGTGTIRRAYSGSSTLTHEQNPYSQESFYFLSNRDVEQTPTWPTFSPKTEVTDSVVRTFPCMLIHESEQAAPGTTGRMLLGEDFRSKTLQSFPFELKDRAKGDPEMTIQLAAKSALGKNIFQLKANDIELEDCEVAGLTGGYSDILTRLGSFIYDIPDDGKEKIDIQITYKPEGVSLTYLSRLDYIRLIYPRRLNIPDEGFLCFNHRASTRVTETLEISGCDATTQVWDITDASRPVILDVKAQSGKISFQALEGSRFYVAFTPAKVTATVTASQSVATQDIHAMETPDMLIITPKVYMTQAMRVAQLHSDLDGMDVAVLTPEEIYNEFSSGVQDVSAFRKLLKMWWDRNPEKIRYCLLFGRATYDNRMITSTVKSAGYPRIPIWQSENSLNETTSFGTDNFIGMLEDCKDYFLMGSARVNVAVGRMPVKSNSEAAIAVDKLENYVKSSDLGAWRNQVMVIADDADNGQHLSQAQKVIDNMQKGVNGKDFIYERLYLDSYPLGTGTSKSYPAARERMLKLWNEGVSFIDFIGHGNPMGLTHENLFTYSDVNAMSNKRLPIMLAATCEFMRFDDDNISAAELLWLNPKGGTIAFIAANRKVYVSNNGLFNAALAGNYFGRDAEGKPLRLGDIYRMGLNDYPNTDDNRHRYALMGDPAMKVVNPELRVAIEQIGSTDLTSLTENSDLPVIHAQSKVTVRGRITDADGATLTDFNGRISPTLFDAERAITTYGHPTTGEDDGKVMMYNDRKNKLFTGTYPVKNGIWEATLLLPLEIDNNYSPALLNMYAWTDDGLEANGSTEKFYVYGYSDEEETDDIDPEIKAMGLNTYAFREGSVVNPTPTFVAQVRDESGINISSSGIGKQMTIIVDGRRIYEDVVNYYTPDIEDYCGGSIAYPLPEMKDGDHSLEFIVWDNAGNSTRRSLTFTVASDKTPTVSVYTDASPATSGVTFFISPDMPAEGMTSHMEVYDLSGYKVWEADTEADSSSTAAPMQIRWDLNDRGGTRVARGIYIYRCTVTDKEGQQTTATRKLAVSAP